MKHLILTRFNVLMPGWKSQINLDSDWLDGRFKLFEELCLPSVASQTNQHFEWLVFFDTKTPQKFKDKINGLVCKYAFRPVYVDYFDIISISKSIFNTPHEEDMLLTTRLDSDDVLATDFVEKLQKTTCNIKNKCVINFDQGAILQSKNNRYALYEYEDISNPFTSLLEPFKADLTTILAVNHTQLHSFAKVLHIKEKPMWLQVVHGGNVSNRVRGKRVKLREYNTFFPYMQTISLENEESDYKVLFDNIILGKYRQLRDCIRIILKSIYLKIKK